jgi:predicted RNA polymerase sigma factor
LEVWRIRGMPENPSAWLMDTAKNSALDVLRRERTARTFTPELGRFLQSEWTLAPVVEELFAASAIKDDLLRMMLSCCHPRLPEAAQVALVLHILCGFSVDEIASAFVTTHAATEKRLTRAKKVLAGSKRLFDITAPADFSARLPAPTLCSRKRTSQSWLTRSTAPSTCCSTRATTVPRPKRQYVLNYAGRQCGSQHYSWSTHSVGRP